MVSVNKIRDGLAAYLDAELMPQLPKGGWQSIVVGTALGVVLSRADKLIENLKNSQLAQMVEVVDTDGSIDLDTIRDMLKAQIERQGSLIIDNVPILKKLVFKAEDVDKAYEFIMRG